MMRQPIQRELFEHVATAYSEADHGMLDNETLYRRVAEYSGIEPEFLYQATDIGGRQHSLVKRAIRWHQQTMKHLGILEREEGQRGVWRRTEKVGKDLTRLQAGIKLVAFSTNLGLAIWGACDDTLPDLDTPIALCITSPPYLLRKPRAYGNPRDAVEYVDFICHSLEPIVRNLLPGGSICLNITNDAFEQGLPSRSLYRERLVIALHERLGLCKMDELIWHNPTKPPGPVRWASMDRTQLNVAYEPIYWFTNDPGRVRADNRAVLMEHTEAHKAFLQRVSQRGQHNREAVYGDGAYRLRASSYSQTTLGRIPRNVLSFGHRCQDSQAYRRDAERLGLPKHGAMMPLSIPDFLIRFLTRADDLVIDHYSGTVTTGMAAERLGRRWIAVELMYEYLRAGAERFRSCAGFEMGPTFGMLHP